MRIVLFIEILLLFYSNSFGQLKKDSTIVEYIKQQKRYVALIDTINLTKIVKPYYNCVVDYMSKYNMDKNAYYIDTTTIDDYKDSSLIITIYHYNGFKRIKENDDQNREANKNKKDGDLIELFELVGNPEEGYCIIIDKKAKKVISVSTWN